jgi:hypothetical protein
MFYQEEKVNDALKCSKCDQRLDEPWILPCGEIVCSSCVTLVQITDSKFKCLVCDKIHMMPEDGLPKNKNILALLSMQSSEVYRSQSVENLRDLLNDISKQITSLKFSINNGIDRIEEFSSELRNDVQLTTEEVIQQISEHRDKFIEEVNEFKKKAIQTYQPNEKSKEDADKSVKELENFQSEWSQYLKKTKISDQDILNAIEQATKLKEKANQAQLIINDSIFNGNMLKFDKNSNKLEKSVLGSLVLEIPKKIQLIASNQHSALNLLVDPNKVPFDMNQMEFTVNEIPSRVLFNSTIISSDQKRTLEALCGFSSEKTWKLHYRGTRDGFSANSFHSKCDNKKNTFVIIKSTNGNIFGGYTEESWSCFFGEEDENEFKSDPKAFIFSLRNKNKTPIVLKCHDPAGAICCNKTYGPSFGDGDIVICSDSNSNFTSYSNLGYSYEVPNYNDDNYSFLAGTEHIKTIEIEVYEIDFFFE